MVTHIARDAIWPGTVLYVSRSGGNESASEHNVQFVLFIDWSVYSTCRSVDNGMYTQPQHFSHSFTLVKYLLGSGSVDCLTVCEFFAKYTFVCHYRIACTTHFIWYIWLKPKWLSRFEPCTSSALTINHSCWCVRSLTQSNDFFFQIVFLYHFELVTHTMRVSHYKTHVTCIVRFHRIFVNCHEFITEHMQSCCDVVMTRKSIKLLRTWQEQMVKFIWQIFEIEICPCYDAGRKNWRELYAQCSHPFLLIPVWINLISLWVNRWK